MSGILSDSQLASARSLFGSYADIAPAGSPERFMSVAALVQFIRDSGLPPLLEGDVRDIVANMKQSDTVSQRNSEVLALQSAVGSGPSPDVDGGGAVVPFYLFVEIMLMGERELLSMCNRTGMLPPGSEDSLDSELLAVFRQVDIDRDGIISASDLQATLQAHFPGSTSETLRHIQAVLSELDVDSDGRVDFEDFKKALKAS